MGSKESISIKKAIDDLMKTTLFREIALRNNKEYANKLAVWLVRYILVVTSMNEALKISLEKALMNLHGETFQKILEITETTFHNVENEKKGTDPYIW